MGYNLYRDQILINQLDNNTFIFLDYSASDNTTHEYCVASINECGESEYSCNHGSKKDDAYSVENVDASDGIYEEVVVIAWDESENADSYTVYRNGVKLINVLDYAATDGKDVVLETPVGVGSTVQVVAYKGFNLTQVKSTNADFTVSGKFYYTPNFS